MGIRKGLDLTGVYEFLRGREIIFIKVLQTIVISFLSIILEFCFAYTNTHKYMIISIVFKQIEV